MFGESSAIYPPVVIHLFVPTMLRWNIVPFRKLSEFHPPKKSRRAFPREGTWIFERFLRAPYEFSTMEKKKRVWISLVLDYSDRYSRAILSFRSNDRLGEGKRPVACYDNIYGTRSIEPTPLLRSKEWRGNISFYRNNRVFSVRADLSLNQALKDCESSLLETTFHF